MSDGFHATLHGDAVGAAQKIQSFFIPKIDARLKADLYRTLSNPLKQAAHVLAHAKDFIDEIDVLDAASYQRIHFLQNSVNAAFAELIAKERLIAEGASPGTSTRKLNLNAKTVVIGEYVMAMRVRFNVVVREIKRPERCHIRDSRTGT